MNKYFIGDMSLSLETTKLFGGKAQKLHELLTADFSVPKGIVLTDIVDIFEADIERIGGFPVAVRSSGALEDLGQASFAGQYDTFLNVSSMDELKKRIRDCFESRYSDRVKDYLRNKKIEWSPETLKMSVLIQKMVRSKISGVIFTINPLTGIEEEMLVEFCEGLGERLVSGHVTPSLVIYNWFEDKKQSERINLENTKIDDAHLNELIEIAAKIQAYYGSPQDIEWAIGSDDKLYILQSRPVTTFTPRLDTPELTDADFKDGGVSARVCTPFMFSVYREALEFSMGDYFKNINLIPNDENIQWIHYHYGRVYWNAEAVKEGLKKIPGFKEDDFDRDLGVQKDYGQKGPHKTALTIGSMIGAIPVLIGLQREYLNCKNMIELFRTKFEIEDEFLKSQLKDIRKMNDLTFRDWFLKVIHFQNHTEKNYFRTIYNNSNFQTEFKSFLKKIKAYSFGDEIDLMSELTGVAHLDVQSGLGKLRKAADFYGFESQTYHSEREKFLLHHYHHGPAELDLFVPRWGEKKEWVDELVLAYNPNLNGVKGKFEQTYYRLSESLNFFGRRKFLKLTEDSRKFLRLREEMRTYSTRSYYLLRLGLLEFCKREDLSEKDGFMLDILEIKNKLLKMSKELPATKKRMLYYEGYRHFTPPNDFGGTIQTKKISPTDGLKGVGCSPGVFTGRARVILDIHATHHLTKDDILVTAFTDPGWTPVLARVGGVVTEVGGLLSHAAVIGREYGIPAILNLNQATKHIKDGDIIKIDGKTGELEILEKSS
jgi:phosphohistidine swiveling domain-containing protein